MAVGEEHTLIGMCLAWIPLEDNGVLVMYLWYWWLVILWYWWPCMFVSLANILLSSLMFVESGLLFIWFYISIFYFQYHWFFSLLDVLGLFGIYFAFVFLVSWDKWTRELVSDISLFILWKFVSVTSPILADSRHIPHSLIWYICFYCVLYLHFFPFVSYSLSMDYLEVCCLSLN